VSHHYVANLWRETGLQPHRQGTFKVSRDPEFADRVADIVGLYLDPPETAETTRWWSSPPARSTSWMPCRPAESPLSRGPQPPPRRRTAGHQQAAGWLLAASRVRPMASPDCSSIVIVFAVVAETTTPWGSAWEAADLGHAGR
jgi:hypothetical protein